jgi:hypothetical protein
MGVCHRRLGSLFNLFLPFLCDAVKAVIFGWHSRCHFAVGAGCFCKNGANELSVGQTSLFLNYEPLSDKFSGASGISKRVVIKFWTSNYCSQA